jgi:hypothetical protein
MLSRRYRGSPNNVLHKTASPKNLRVFGQLARRVSDFADAVNVELRCELQACTPLIPP